MIFYWKNVSEQILITATVLIAELYDLLDLNSTNQGY